MSDWEFIFDGVFGFLTSPLWEVPIMSFIETQSIVFEPSEENNESWVEIHGKYKSLVESLLSSYLNDVGITEQQFTKACGSPSAQDNPAMQAIYEQLYAAESYETFKRMMIQRNVELQLQALELIKKRQGIAKKKSKNATKPHQPISQSEEEILAEVMRRSEEEYKEAQKKNKAEDDVYNKSMEEMISQSHDVNERLEQEVLEKQEETKQSVSQSINGLEEPPVPVMASQLGDHLQDYEPAPTNSQAVKKREPPKAKQAEKPKLAPLKNEPSKSVTKEGSKDMPKKLYPDLKEKASTDAAANWISDAKRENASSSPPKPMAQATEEDLKKRAEYLKQQRDKLLAMKKQEREKQLSEYTKSQPKRPSSARVAKQAVTGEIAAPAPSAEDQKRMAMRKALAEKLKKEVVYK
ncbi:cilia- and flagella-associated protein 36-like [Hydractinia symbiolongicarpus]|uniref:cilia- and flagella-associated protein 36-like n=1 Tax=Hydractinia symbiolongicarpus TaxID=13093 RepID=UPI00254BEC68|nr:cilia- and flagella-associated protein 36-like [Hydractinia symbiolongicarpus]